MERFLLEGIAPVTYGRGKGLMKIYFLLMIVSVFVAFSYIPLASRAEADRGGAP